MMRIDAIGIQRTFGLPLLVGLAVAACFIQSAIGKVPPTTERAGSEPTSSSALVKVMPSQPVSGRPPRNDAGESTVQPASFGAVCTHAVLLSHKGLVARVIADPNSAIRKTEWFKKAGDAPAAHRWLGEHLHADPVPSTDLIRVYLDAPPAGSDGAVIIETIVEQYLKEQEDGAQSLRMERVQMLNNLKVRYETRVRELVDRQNNRILLLDLAGIGAGKPYPATELELEALERKRAELVAQATESPDAPVAPATKPADNAHETSARASLAAVDHRIDELKQKLGDLAIAMSDYLSITGELRATRQDLHEVKSQLDAISSGAQTAAVIWAEHPMPVDGE